MKVLIVGGTSALGKSLKPVLSQFSDVLTAGRHHCDVRLDLEDPVGKISCPEDVDVIIHTAAHFGGGPITEMIDAEFVNTIGTLKLCNLALQVKAKHFVLVSSMSACVPKTSEYFNIYALSKRHSEEVAAFFCSTHSLPLSILRPTQIYGSSNDFRKHQPFIYSMIDNAEKDNDIVIYGSRDAKRNYIYIDDLTTIISKVVLHKVEGAYSCMHTSDVKYSEVAKAAIAAFNSQSRFSFLNDKPDIPDNIFEKDFSLYEKINFYPGISLQEGMRRIAAYRNR